MAFKQIIGTKVYVYTYDPKTRRQKKLPRKLTRHLDGSPIDVIDEWIRRWEQTQAAKRRRPDLVISPLPADWLQYVVDFCEMLRQSGRAHNTIRAHQTHIEMSLPFFVDRGCTSLAEFHLHSRLLGEWLITVRKKSPRRVWAINQSLTMFWKYLDIDRGLVESTLRLVGGKKTRNRTPLRVALTPAEILSHTFAREDLRLFALLGYFFSLRPQEVLALTPGHFKAGTHAQELECCKTLVAAELYGKLAVNVVRQKVGKQFRAPKKNSSGWVGCFNEQAAREIVKLLVGRRSTDLLFPLRTDAYYKAWKNGSIPNTVSKDMRRASLYHLGHYSKLPVVALKNHARHASIETTMLYTRRPEELSEMDWIALDLDA